MDNLAFNKDENVTVPPKNYSTCSYVKSDDVNPPEEDDKKLSQRIWISYLRQVALATVIASGGNVVSFLVSSTSLLPSILNTGEDQQYNPDNLKWLASGPILFTILGNFAAVLITEKFGPAFVLRQSLLFCFLLYIIIAFLPTITVIWITRIVMWTTVGMFDIISVPLIALLSEPCVRGVTGVLPDLTGSFGVFFVFVLFSFLDGTHSILLSSIPVLLGFMGSLLVPESPIWLIQRGRLSEAENSIGRAIGPKRQEKKDELLQEIIFKYNININDKTKIINKTIPVKQQIMLLRKPENWKPVLLSVAIFAFREFGANYVIFFHALTFFEAAKIPTDKFTSTITISLSRLFSTVISTSFQDKFGRRVVLIGTSLLSALCLIISGLILFFDLKQFGIVSLIGIIIFILMTGIGMGPVPFIILGEIIPSDIKFLGTAIVYSAFNFYQFVIVAILPVILSNFTAGTLLITFAILNFVFGMILYFILPETKCKTLREIEEMFK